MSPSAIQYYTLFLTVVFCFLGFESSTLGIIGVISMASSMAVNNNNNRHLVLWWYIFALLTTTAFSSSIVSRLTFPIYEETIDRVEQLLNKNFYWGKFYGNSNISNILNMEVIVCA